MSVSSSRFEAEVVTWCKREGGANGGSTCGYGQKMASCTVKKEQRTDCYVHTMKAGCNKENGAINVIAEGEKNSVLILVRLAEKENGSK